MRKVKYLLAHEADYSWGIRTTTVGMQLIPPGAQFPYGEHPQAYFISKEKGRVLLDEMHVLYLLKGKGWFESAHCPKTRIQAGDAVFIYPNEWHNYAPDKDTGWEEAWIGFSGEFLTRIVQEKFFDISYPIIEIGIRETIKNAIEKAYRIAEDEWPAYQQQLAGYVFLVVSSIYAYSKQAPFKDTPEMKCIINAQKYMREHTSQNLCMEEVAKHAGLGYSKFRKIFRNYTGFSPQQYFVNLKLEESKDLLLNTLMSIKEIAFRLGFDSTTYFTRVFRQHFCQTPLDFREKGERN